MTQKILPCLILLLLITAVMFVSGCTGNDAPEPAGKTVLAPSIPEPVVMSGTGRMFTDTFELKEGLAVFKIRHMVASPDEYLGIDLVEDTDNDGKFRLDAQLVNKAYEPVTNFNGSKAVKISTQGKYQLQIKADSDARWEIIAEQPVLARAAKQAHELSGKSMQATGLFYLPEGKKTFTLKHGGESNFIVELLDNKGNRVAGLANEIGLFEGKKEVDILFPGNYLLDIEADGIWQVNIK
ncbi:MAG: hypothetical protein OIN89_03555 [Candidatus Methanoperedens sp.]|jgi:hypothetical protein|nr:hypothetical protein [Candidatus Methanoperedens sp.]PKL54109.1 MAG: hypothetical protein CVV36_03485 [Candidatus Methanoperedenaceae archaeon HGW-Methanoperedenaceae-1]